MRACSIQGLSLCQNKQPSLEHTHYKGQMECAAQHFSAKHRLHKHAEKGCVDLYTHDQPNNLHSISAQTTLAKAEQTMVKCTSH